MTGAPVRAGGRRRGMVASGPGRRARSSFVRGGPPSSARPSARAAAFRPVACHDPIVAKLGRNECCPSGSGVDVPGREPACRRADTRWGGWGGGGQASAGGDFSSAEITNSPGRARPAHGRLGLQALDLGPAIGGVEHDPRPRDFPPGAASPRGRSARAPSAPRQVSGAPPLKSRPRRTPSPSHGGRRHGRGARKGRSPATCRAPTAPPPRAGPVSCR
jgi:hypothetical protein